MRATASAWRLGHAAHDNETGTSSNGRGVRVWLPHVRLNSTHDLAAGMSVAPENAGAVDGEDEDQADGQEEGDGEGAVDGFDAGEFRCKVCYTVEPSGVVTVESDVTMPEHWPVIPRWVSK